MHSSRMRTVDHGGVPAQGCTCLGGVPVRGVYLPVGYLPGGVPGQGGTCPGGVPARGGNS